MTDDNDDGDLDDNDEDNIVMSLMKVVNVNMAAIMMATMIVKSHGS